MVKRQTVWLSTMMILSLMIIGYYTINDTIQPVPTQSVLTNPVTKTNEVAVQHKDQNTGAATQKSDPQKPAAQKSDPQKTMAEPSDYFLNAQLKREQAYSQKVADLQATMASAGKSNADIAKANAELKTMQDFKATQEEVEAKVEALGYPAALVEKDNNGYVTVTVQAKTLSAQEAAKINSTVQQEMKVAAINIIIASHE